MCMDAYTVGNLVSITTITHSKYSYILKLFDNYLFKGFCLLYR